ELLVTTSGWPFASNVIERPRLLHAELWRRTVWGTCCGENTPTTRLSRTPLTLPALPRSTGPQTASLLGCAARYRTTISSAASSPFDPPAGFAVSASREIPSPAHFTSSYIRGKALAVGPSES